MSWTTFAWIRDNNRHMAWNGHTTARLVAEDLREGDSLAGGFPITPVTNVATHETSPRGRAAGRESYYVHATVEDNTGENTYVFSPRDVIEVDADFADTWFEILDDGMGDRMMLTPVTPRCFEELDELVVMPPRESLVWGADLHELACEGITLDYHEEPREQVRELLNTLPRHDAYDATALDWAGNEDTMYALVDLMNEVKSQS